MERVNNGPKISIITVVFNGEHTIEKTIQSVLSQSYSNIEYIIIDGSSTDKTMEIISKYKDRVAKVISEPDKGIYDAINKGIKISKGDLIGIINSDDWYEDEALKIIVESYDPSIDIYHGYLRVVKDGKEYSVYRNSEKFLDEKMISHPTCFISRDMYKKLGNYSLKYNYSSDFELMLRAKNIGAKFKSIDAIIANFSLGGVSGEPKAVLETISIRREFGLPYKAHTTVIAYLAVLISKIKKIAK